MGVQNLRSCIVSTTGKDPDLHHRETDFDTLSVLFPLLQQITFDILVAICEREKQKENRARQATGPKSDVAIQQIVLNSSRPQADSSSQNPESLNLPGISLIEDINVMKSNVHKDTQLVLDDGGRIHVDKSNDEEFLSKV